MKKTFTPHTDVGMPIFTHTKPLEPYSIEDFHELKPNSKSPLPEGASGHTVYEDHPLTLFDLSSHKRAREAIEFGLRMRNKGFHVFVLGADRSGRMTSTMTYLKQYMKSMPAPKDWIYLNNFTNPHKPLPFSFEAGKAIVFQAKYTELMEKVNLVLSQTFKDPSYIKHLEEIQQYLQNQINEKIDEIQHFALENHLKITESDEGWSVEPLSDSKKKNNSSSTLVSKNTEEKELSASVQNAIQEVKDALSKIETMALDANITAMKKVNLFSQSLARKKLTSIFQRFRADYEDEKLKLWIDSLKEDILTHLIEFAPILGATLKEETLDPSAPPFYQSDRYKVNILVDNSDFTNGRVILEPNPDYKNLFGSITYATNPQGGHETNFTLIRKGALHSANNGILVLRADAIAKNPEVWEYLKAALRDGVIRIEEQYRDNSFPLADAPKPEAIPLDIQVFLIASPYWYYNFFFHDPEFRSYFKIKADIEEDMPATLENVQTYRALLRHNCIMLTGKNIDEEALDYIIAYSARWAENRQRLSSKFEQIADVLLEAYVLSAETTTITKQAVQETLKMRRSRNTRTEDHCHEDIVSGQILIDTEGSTVGQVNGLTVISTGDHDFGLPSRISARSYIGELGILNIERLTELAGPIQQKGTLILEGFLNGLLAQKFPLSYSCSLTFEQSYNDVDGDSASMAEVIAILSSLSGIPVRQDLAITGSMNQFGVAQPIGGTHFKVEGFHRLCCQKGLTGAQGVIIPRLNLCNLTLRENIIEDIQNKKFFIWPVTTVFEAIEIMMGHNVGIEYDAKGAVSDTYPFYAFQENSILAKAEKILAKYYELASQKESN